MGSIMHLLQNCETFFIDWFQCRGIMLLIKNCITFQVPLPPHQVFGSIQVHLQTHKAHSNFHICHDPPCHENPPNNLPFDNLKHRMENKYLATFQEVAHFEL